MPSLRNDGGSRKTKSREVVRWSVIIMYVAWIRTISLKEKNNTTGVLASLPPIFLQFER